ncbi:Acyl CoA:acetate/3-ketoacid CoA transferase, beta subunit [Archaeoglobus sulfaticallidus PM70-1]|uniref:Acyl CoA:acetate/3-ketoacid CoA transferase, beta subunit n=1 Tax=Archaeoglobus sulfaticallidus PM70-1 TaxID=387631 RepID=N0BJ62_9EURY|nr:acyl CoA--acetate/3-ketoacid CoA transferase subunit beta [Archaeoglobus sulfaticallidus]AGK60210.1 Acyl CoA:acetate/3-ketoacid CoA transferase, beta subunit [Archaeoglobus sulfaticallidus PM70-1]
MAEIEFTDTEFMICNAARLLEDNKTIFVGWGIPQVVAILAEKLYTPNIVQVFEFGAIGPLSRTPFLRGTMGGPSNTYRSLQWCSMNLAFSYAQAGYIDYGMLGAAQIDRYGNINSTMIGDDYEKPKVRFPGSGGGNEVASYCWKTIIVMAHEKRRFVERCDFITSPGYMIDGKSRDEVGLPAETGPYRVITSMGMFGFDEKTKELKLIGVMKGLTVDEVLDEMNIEPLVAEKVVELEPPTELELKTLREDIDPYGLIISKGRKIKLDI